MYIMIQFTFRSLILRICLYLPFVARKAMERDPFASWNLQTRWCLARGTLGWRFFQSSLFYCKTTRPRRFIILYSFLMTIKRILLFPPLELMFIKVVSVHQFYTCTCSSIMQLYMLYLMCSVNLFSVWGNSINIVTFQSFPSMNPFTLSIIFCRPIYVYIRIWLLLFFLDHCL